MITPTFISLFGPVDANGALVQTCKGDRFYWPGSCLSSHTFQFAFNLPHKTVASGTWRVCWALQKKTATPTILQLVNAADGPSNIQQMATISSANAPSQFNVWNMAVSITAQMNALVAAKVAKQIGWMMKSDNSSMITIYVSRLELFWQD